MTTRMPYETFWANAHKLMLAMILPFALSACALAPAHQSNTAFPLLKPASLGSAHGARQLIHAAFGTRDIAFQSIVDVNPDQLTVIGLSAEGQRLFSLRHDGRTLQSDLSPQIPDRLDPMRVLTDLQLAMWPLHILQESLANSSWEVSDPAASTRRLRYAGELVAEVHYAGADPWNGGLWIVNFRYGYSLAIESQPLQ